MKIFYAPKTRAVRIFWMLEEAGIEYDKELVDIRAPERNDPAEFLAASPMGKVPALVDGDVAMAESAAICLYVADRYAMGTLAPALDDSQREALLRDIPLQRLGDPADIAAAVLFLASEQGSYITGQTLHVNGGMFMI